MLYDKINADMKNAMINHDKETLSTIRMLKSSIDLYKINNKLESVSDEVVIDVASKQVKTHRESILEFERANRTDLIEKLNNEIKLLQTYLPVQLTEEEINVELDNIFKSVNPTGKQDMGKIMKEVSAIFRGKADMKLVSTLVNDRINSL